MPPNATSPRRYQSAPRVTVRPRVARGELQAERIKEILESAWAPPDIDDSCINKLDEDNRVSHQHAFVHSNSTAAATAHEREQWEITRSSPVAQFHPAFVSGEEQAPAAQENERSDSGAGRCNEGALCSPAVVLDGSRASTFSEMKQVHSPEALREDFQFGHHPAFRELQVPDERPRTIPDGLEWQLVPHRHEGPGQGCPYGLSFTTLPDGEHDLGRRRTLEERLHEIVLSATDVYVENMFGVTPDSDWSTHSHCGDCGCSGSRPALTVMGKAYMKTFEHTVRCSLASIDITPEALLDKTEDEQESIMDRARELANTAATYTAAMHNKFEQIRTRVQTAEDLYHHNRTFLVRNWPDVEIGSVAAEEDNVDETESHKNQKPSPVPGALRRSFRSRRPVVRYGSNQSIGIRSNPAQTVHSQWRPSRVRRYPHH